MATRPDRIVVIGAGLGGLAAALRLAHAGCAVTVLDLHQTPGGKARQIDSPAGPVDAGPTVLTLRGVFDDLFEETGARLDDHVVLTAEPLLARHHWPDGASLDLWSDEALNVEAVDALAGAKEADGFRRFSAEARALYAAFDAPVMRAPAPSPFGIARALMGRPGLTPALMPGQTLARRLRRHFADPRLRQLFGRYATYVGGTPARTPALLSLIWQAEAGGVWRVDGGLHALARAIAARAETLGARILYSTTATGIERREGTVTAVETADGTRLPCDAALFNGDPEALRTGMVQGATDAVTPRQARRRSLSASVWAFAAKASGVDLAHHNVFFCADPADEFDPLDRGAPTGAATLYVCAEDRGTGLTPPDLERFEIIMNAPPLPGGAEEEPPTCRFRTFPALARHGLTFTPPPPDSALTTPQGFETLSPGSAGALYGLSPHGMMAAFRRPTARSRIAGLYLAGGGVHPGPGVPMATLSGRHAAAAILSDRPSTSTSRRTATPGGTSTASATTAPAPSASSAS
ncbi:1-hydroxycarotenoid 3,4-desaturase [Tranquillimonas rosea]|uniref:1-hydroxycarotenoid 3,4-desaturase n=1 Tax=Tranquillimonas rosea TaxID=641238 RepID=A0A1H9SJZ1_9RHOB|nr:1-hydroxycarotenoid 3,4-desaturase CrtD [Tranquillimonas rosea]SER85218.1 1-hydroxycarotenoid 3,4-desaturase [Tranquillimonas rosea]